MTKISEHDRVILRRDLADLSLCAGDLGTVVLVHGDSEGFEVEFMTLDGETIGVTTLIPDDIRPIGRREMAHVRPL